MNVVLDSSVIAKWYLDEEQKQEALKLRRLHIENKLTITAPALLILELSNIFVTRKLDQNDYDGNLEKILQFRINFIEPDSLTLKSSFAFSKQFRLSFYDATYVACAQKLKCDFVTADKKLYRTTKRLKFVKLLGQTSY